MGRAITRLREQCLSFFLVSVLAMIPPQARGVACARWAAGSQSWLCVEAGAEGVTRLQFWEEGWEATYLGWDLCGSGGLDFRVKHLQSSIFQFQYSTCFALGFDFEAPDLIQMAECVSSIDNDNLS
jgi:hypothetical protein